MRLTIQIPSLLALALSGIALTAQAATNESSVGSNSFGAVSEKNLFDLARGRTQTPSTVAPPARTESLKLVGTLQSEQGAFAFFSSSSSQFRKVVRPGESIAEYKVTEIAHDYVRLAANNKQTITLPVQQEMKLTGVNSISWEK